MLNSELQLKLKEQKILPILNTTTLSNDIDRLSKYLEKNRAIRYIEVTLRENQSFDIALELKEHFTKHKFGLGSVLTKEDFIKGQDHNFHFFGYFSMFLHFIVLKIDFRLHFFIFETFSFSSLQTYFNTHFWTKTDQMRAF